MQFSDYDHRWPAQFAQERERLLTALGELTAGGIVDNLQHIGATSVPGLPAYPCVDVGLAVWPFPLEPQPRQALAALGYEPVSGYEGPPEQRFRHATEAFQLHIVEPGSDRWTDYLLLRDYLQHNEAAGQAYSRSRQTSADSDAANYQNVKPHLFRQTLTAAHQWWINHYGFGPVEAVRDELKGFPHPWYIAGGWGLDLFLGRVTRVHHDVDVVTARTDQLALQEHLALQGWQWITPFQGKLGPWPARMTLELPRHQAHAHREGAFIDFLLSDIEAGVWRYRRQPAIIRTGEQMSLSTGEGISFLAPDLVLLFKSRNTSAGRKERPQDQADFENAYPHLDPERRAWLRWALIATDPGHDWIDQLG